MPITALPPNRMTAAERLDEVAAILAAGCRRLITHRRVGKENARNIKDKRKSGLDLVPDRSVHGDNTDPSGEGR